MTIIASILKTMEDYAQKNHVPIIKGEAAGLLIKTVRKHRPKSVLEIGTAIGYSSILVAMNSPEANIVTIELDAERISKARTFLTMAGLSDRVEIIEGDAGQVITKLNSRFDMVFIDAAKGQYLNYLNDTIDKLTENAVIFADNVLFRGMVEGDIATPRRYRTIVNRLRQFLDFIENDQRFCTSLYRVGDGVAISIYQGADIL